MELMTRTCKFERMNVERLFARLFVVAGGAFWVIATFSADYFYNRLELAEALASALLPLGIALLALAIGWFYEVLAAVLLFAGSVAAVVWGVVAGWELGVWFTMATVLIGPMVLAGVLFLLAARMQNVCKLEGHPEA